MKDIISGNECVTNLVRKDKTTLIYSIFKNKYNATLAVKCAINICDDIENRLLKLQQIDRTLTDKIIMILKVHKHDLQQFHRYQISFIRSNYIKPTNYWIYLNETAKASLKNLTSWHSNLMLPMFTENMKYQKFDNLTDWLSNQYNSFDSSQLQNTHNNTSYYSYRSRNYNTKFYRNNYNNKRNNNTWKYQNKYSQNSYNNNQTHGTMSNTNTGKLNQNKMMFDYTKSIMKKLHPTQYTKWNASYCGFWNTPNIECKLLHCKRKHECPLCQSNSHKIGACERLTDQNKLNSQK